MADAFQKVSVGEPLMIPAAAWNAALDAAEAYRALRDGSNTPHTSYDPLTLLIKNSSGSDLDRFSVVSVQGTSSVPMVNATDNLEEFQRKPNLEAVTPSGSTGAIGILMEPIANGLLGHALIAGITPCKVNVTDSSHWYADATSGSSTYLTSAASGGRAVVLWKESGTGTKWAYVLLDRAGGGSLTCKDEDGSPVYTGVDTIRAYQTEGVHFEALAGAPAGSADLRLYAASRTQAGSVSTGNQQWTGTKGSDGYSIFPVGSPTVPSKGVNLHTDTFGRLLMTRYGADFATLPGYCVQSTTEGVRGGRSDDVYITGAGGTIYLLSFRGGVYDGLQVFPSTTGSGFTGVLG